MPARFEGMQLDIPDILRPREEEPRTIGDLTERYKPTPAPEFESMRITPVGRPRDVESYLREGMYHANKMAVAPRTMEDFLIWPLYARGVRSQAGMELGFKLMQHDMQQKAASQALAHERDRIRQDQWDKLRADFAYIKDNVNPAHQKSVAAAFFKSRTGQKIDSALIDMLMDTDERTLDELFNEIKSGTMTIDDLARMPMDKVIGALRAREAEKESAAREQLAARMATGAKGPAEAAAGAAEGVRAGLGAAELRQTQAMLATPPTPEERGKMLEEALKAAQRATETAAPAAGGPGPSRAVTGPPATQGAGGWVPTWKMSVTTDLQTGEMKATMTQDDQPFTESKDQIGNTIRIGKRDGRIEVIPTGDLSALNLNEGTLEAIATGATPSKYLTSAQAQNLLVTARQARLQAEITKIRAAEAAKGEAELAKRVGASSLKDVEFRDRKTLDTIHLMHMTVGRVYDMMDKGEVLPMDRELSRRVNDIKAIERLLPTMRAIAKETLAHQRIPGANLLNYVNQALLMGLGKDVPLVQLRTLEGVRLLMSRMMQGAAQQLSNLDVRITEAMTVRPTDSVEQAMTRLNLLDKILEAQIDSIRGKQPTVPRARDDFDKEIQKEVDRLNATSPKASGKIQWRK